MKTARCDGASFRVWQGYTGIWFWQVTGPSRLDHLEGRADTNASARADARAMIRKFNAIRSSMSWIA